MQILPAKYKVNYCEDVWNKSPTKKDWSYQTYYDMVNQDKFDKVIIVGGGFSKLPPNFNMDGFSLFCVNGHPILGEPIKKMTYDLPLYGIFSTAPCLEKIDKHLVGSEGTKNKICVDCEREGWKKVRLTWNPYFGPEYVDNSTEFFPKFWRTCGYDVAMAFLTMSNVEEIAIAGFDGWMSKDKVEKNTYGHGFNHTAHSINREFDIIEYAASISPSKVTIGKYL